MLLVTFNDIKAIKPFNENVNKDRIDILIREIQDSKLPELLGHDLYFDLLANYTTDAYKAIINGSSYVIDDITYNHLGLKYVITYFVHARWSREGGYQETHSGYVMQNNNDSVRLSESQKSSLENNYNNLATSYWDGVRLFLNENTETYTHWNCKKASFKISRVQRNDKF